MEPLLSFFPPGKQGHSYNSNARAVLAIREIDHGHCAIIKDKYAIITTQSKLYEDTEH